MKIGFFAQGQGSYNDDARLMMQSARRVMPQVPIYHLTDDVTEPLAEPVRLGGEMPLAVRRAALHGLVDGDWLFVDTDVIFRADVSHVFEKPFDIAVARRRGQMDGNDYPMVMPFNCGVVFSRNKQFWLDMIEPMKKLDPKIQKWDGLQFMLGFQVKKGGYQVEILPAEFNFAPKNPNEDVSKAAIVHYKGKRKAWMAVNNGE